MAYTAPTVTDLGTLSGMTLDLNKVGHNPDVYSNTVPIVGSIVPAH